jgi:hypothetical protein
VHSHLPYFLSAYSNTTLASTLGFQPVPQDKPVFLEQYLGCPVEQAIFLKTNHTVSRKKVVEIGSLSSARKGFSELIFILIAAILYEAGYEWVVFTATRQVQQLVDKLQLTTFELCDADPMRLEDKGSSWGRYYDTNPKVLAGNLHEGMAVLSQHRVASFMIDNYRHIIDNYVDKLVKLTS